MKEDNDPYLITEVATNVLVVYGCVNVELSAASIFLYEYLWEQFAYCQTFLNEGIWDKITLGVFQSPPTTYGLILSDILLTLDCN